MANGLRTSSPSDDERHWVYRADWECVVFAPRRWYDWHICILEALTKAKTWGEFEALMPDDAFADVVACFDDDENPQPAAEATFSKEQVGRFYDGIYPRGLLERMGEWMPADLFTKYGKLTGNPGWGAWTEIDLEQAEDLANELRQRGYELTPHHGETDFF